jgi:transcriptional regulator with XRE-family HTH domain
MSRPKLKAGLDPVANAIGKKLQAIRMGRKLTQEQCAEQIGIGLQYYLQIEAGLFVPAKWLGKRILDWALKGKVFSIKASDDRAKDGEIRRQKDYRVINVKLHQIIRDRLEMQCKRLGITMGEFIEVAIERLLDEPNELKSYDEAIGRFFHARVRQALAEAPEMRQFLESDLQYAISCGILTEQKIEQKELNPITKLVDIEIESESTWEVD